MRLNASLWQYFNSTPHRLFFLSGAIQLILPILLWSFELVGRYTPLTTPLNTLVPATWAHAFIMLYGIFIFFILGFLISILPHWMKSKTIDKEHYLTAVTWLNIGLFILEFSLFYNAPTIVSGCIIFLLGWTYSIALLYQVIKKAPVKNKSNEIILLLTLIMGAFGIIAYGNWLYTDSWLSMQLSFNIGFWLYLMPIFFTLSVIIDTRLAPKPSKTLKPNISLWYFLTGCIGHFCLNELNYNEWLFLVDIPMAAVTLLYSTRIGLHVKAKTRLSIALHMAYLWLFIGLVLFSIQSLVLLLTTQHILGNSALHIINIGFFTSLIFITTTPASLTKPLFVDNMKWKIFLGLQITTAGYLGTVFLFDHNLLNHNLNLITAILWCICCVLWLVHYAVNCLNSKAILAN